MAALQRAFGRLPRAAAASVAASRAAGPAAASVTRKVAVVRAAHRWAAPAQLVRPFVAAPARGLADAAGSIEAGVIGVIETFLKDKGDVKVTGTSHFADDLGLDSLDAVELVMEIEDKFQLEIDEEQIERMVTVDAIVKYIEEAQSK